MEKEPLQLWGKPWYHWYIQAFVFLGLSAAFVWGAVSVVSIIGIIFRV